MRRLKWWQWLLAVLLVLALAAGGIFYYYNHRADEALNNIQRQDMIPTADDSSSTSATIKDDHAGEALTYLLLGSDSRTKDDPGRSDTMMLAYVPKDRQNVYLISFPRDSYVSIPGYDKDKINTSYNKGGPKLTVSTINQLLNINIMHAATVNFDGFTSLVATLGGVTINNPYEGCDDSQHICWKAGKQTLDHDQALHYVRWRHGLPNGDITRTENQQRVMKAIISQTMSAGTLANPQKVTDLLDQVSGLVTVDSTLSNAEIKNTLLSMRLSSSNNIRSLTLPIKGYINSPRLGALDEVDQTKLVELQQALAKDDMGTYWEKHHNDPPAGDSTAAGTIPESANDPTAAATATATTTDKELQ